MQMCVGEPVAGLYFHYQICRLEVKIRQDGADSGGHRGWMSQPLKANIVVAESWPADRMDVLVKP